MVFFRLCLPHHLPPIGHILMASRLASAVMSCNVSGWPSRSLYDLFSDDDDHHHSCCYQMLLLLSMLSEVVEVV